ncbi:MAG: hypothetical protein H6Q33_1581 [Deltaproteobacteria bacterium]|nr:hypothetical protein [Deltaproteobacteria bacterium]
MSPFPPQPILPMYDTAAPTPASILATMRAHLRVAENGAAPEAAQEFPRKSDRAVILGDLPQFQTLMTQFIKTIATSH